MDSKLVLDVMGRMTCERDERMELMAGERRPPDSRVDGGSNDSLLRPLAQIRVVTW
jgi:hypothetical protein